MMGSVKSVFACGVKAVERHGQYVRLTFVNDAESPENKEKVAVSQIVMDLAHYRLAIVEMTSPNVIGD